MWKRRKGRKSRSINLGSPPGGLSMLKDVVATGWSEILKRGSEILFVGVEFPPDLEAHGFHVSERPCAANATGL